METQSWGVGDRWILWARRSASLTQETGSSERCWLKELEDSAGRTTLKPPSGLHTHLHLCTGTHTEK